MYLHLVRMSFMLCAGLLATTFARQVAAHDQTEEPRRTQVLGIGVDSGRPAHGH